MRLTPIATLCFLLAAAGAFAQDAGSRIVVTAEAAKLQAQNSVVGSVRRGTILTVEDLNGEWSWVSYSSAKETVQGWIHRRDVIPFENALAFFDGSVRRNPSAEVYTIRGKLWTEKQEYDKAIADFNEALRLDPKYASAHSALELARRKRGDSEKAVENPRKAARLDPKHAVTYYKRGLAWQMRGNVDKALADFNQAIRFDPNHANAYTARGVIRLNKGESDQAMADYDEAIRLDPQNAAAHGNRGIAWHKLGKFDKAAADWNEAIRLDPKNVNAHIALAWLLATCADGKYRDGKRAVELATNACELSGWKNPNAIATLAAAYAESGDFENAAKWQEEFLRLCSEVDQKKWGYLLDLYRSKKPFRGQRQEPRYGGGGRHSTECVA